MTREQANELLDKQKDGIVRQSLIKVTEALWQTGDIASPLPKHARPFDPDGITEWLESLCVAQSERTGESLPRDLQGNQSRPNQQNENN
tara:strand:+ start:132 stop:398 length:267 start_codon:yes stop_codon:yes gene_type:complete